jgi:hypothetical protein
VVHEVGVPRRVEEDEPRVAQLRPQLDRGLPPRDVGVHHDAHLTASAQVVEVGSPPVRAHHADSRIAQPSSCDGVGVSLREVDDLLLRRQSQVQRRLSANLVLVFGAVEH